MKIPLVAFSGRTRFTNSKDKCSNCGKEMKNGRDFFMTFEKYSVYSKGWVCLKCAESDAGRKFDFDDFPDVPMNDDNLFFALLAVIAMITDRDDFVMRNLNRKIRTILWMRNNCSLEKEGQ